MTGPASFDIRWATPGDLPALQAFFQQAYGSDSVFTDPHFLHWYFGSDPDTRPMLSLIAADSGGRIAAHYGGIRGDLHLDGRSLPTVWGVSAFTLPEHRGAGLGAALVQSMMDAYPVFGVIGFTPKTAAFYEANGFHVFDRHRFHRHVVMLRPEAWELAPLAGCDIPRLRKLLGEFPAPAPSPGGEPQPLASDVNLSETALVMMKDLRLTMSRAPQFLQWRFRAFPQPAYELHHAENERAAGGAWIALRRERVYPTRQTLSRIVDLYGGAGQLIPLLTALLERCRNRGDSLVDCSLFGSYYRTTMERAGFHGLYEDHAALLPQVTHPAQARPNHEYIGLFSRLHGDQIKGVPLQQVHFTRMSSDRDRLARLDQLSTGEGAA